MTAERNADQGLYDRYWEQDARPPYLESLFPVFETLGIQAGARVLDVGCGNGILGEFLARTFGCEMYGTDVSSVALAAAVARGYKVELADLNACDSDHQPFSGMLFDLVVLSAVLEHVFDPLALLKQAYSLLRDGGCVVVLTPNVTWIVNRVLFALGRWQHPLLGGTRGHIRYMNQSMLRDALLDAGFRNLDWSHSPILVDGRNCSDRRPQAWRRLLSGRSRVWQSLFAENLIVVGRKRIYTLDKTQWACVAHPSRLEGLKVLHIAATPSGASWMLDIVHELRRRGYDASALICSGDGDLARQLERADIPYSVSDLDVSSMLDLIGIARKVFRLVRFLRQGRYNIVHYHLFTSVILGRTAAWLADAPLRFSQITGPFYLEAPAPREVERRTLWMDTRVLPTCKYTRDLYLKLGVSQRKLELIYYGTDTQRFDPDKADGHRLRCELGIADDVPLVGMVAYFYAPYPPGYLTPPHLQGRPIKGHENFVAAARIVLREYPQAKFLLVGKGWETAGERYEQELKGLVKRMGLDDAILFTGFRSDVPDVLAALDVSVQCSLSENLGGTIQSLLMACPLVTTAVGGMVDSVRHEQTGLLVPPDDSQCLAEAILRLLDNPAWARQLGQNGRELMLREFALSKTVADVDWLYQSQAHAVLRHKRNVAGTPRDYGYRLSHSLLHTLTLILQTVAYVLLRDVPRLLCLGLQRIVRRVSHSKERS